MENKQKNINFFQLFSKKVLIFFDFHDIMCECMDEFLSHPLRRLELRKSSGE